MRATRPRAHADARRGRSPREPARASPGRSTPCDARSDSSNRRARCRECQNGCEICTASSRRANARRDRRRSTRFRPRISAPTSCASAPARFDPFASRRRPSPSARRAPAQGRAWNRSLPATGVRRFLPADTHRESRRKAASHRRADPDAIRPTAAFRCSTRESADCRNRSICVPDSSNARVRRPRSCTDPRSGRSPHTCRHRGSSSRPPVRSCCWSRATCALGRWRSQ